MNPNTPTFQEAYDATNPDPAAYGLPADAPEETVTERRNAAAQNLLTGAAANAAYWNSRSELEALRAASEGHGVLVPPPTADAAPSGEVVDGTVEPEGLGSGVAPTPENPVEAVAALRKQLEAAGIQPEV